MSASGTCACGRAQANCDNKTGKGDSPRNISPVFRDNYDQIRWSQSENVLAKKAEHKFIKTY